MNLEKLVTLAAALLLVKPQRAGKDTTIVPTDAFQLLDFLSSFGGLMKLHREAILKRAKKQSQTKLLIMEIVTKGPLRDSEFQLWKNHQTHNLPLKDLDR